MAAEIDSKELWRRAVEPSPELNFKVLDAFPYSIGFGHVSFLQKDIASLVANTGNNQRTLLNACNDRNIAPYHLTLQPQSEGGGISFIPASLKRVDISNTPAAPTGILQRTSDLLLSEAPFYKISCTFSGPNIKNNTHAFDEFRKRHLGWLQTHNYIPSEIALAIKEYHEDADITLKVPVDQTKPILNLVTAEYNNVRLIDLVVDWLRKIATETNYLHEKVEIWRPSPKNA